MENLTRAFIAVELNPSFQKTLTETQNALKKAGASVSWVKPENMHLTLKFLGEIKPKKLKEVLETFPPLASGIKPFKIQLSELGVFPDVHHPKIIWAGVTEKTGELLKLVEHIEIEMAKLGFRKETRDFTAHLTIGRIKTNKNIEELGKLIAGFQFLEEVRGAVDRIALFKSTLTPQGPVYEQLAVSPFK